MKQIQYNEKLRYMSCMFRLNLKPLGHNYIMRNSSENFSRIKDASLTNGWKMWKILNVLIIIR